MSKFPLDLSKFKKVSEDKQYTTLKHPKGHEVRIAHSALSPGMRSKLQSMSTMMEKGGKVKDPTQENLLPGDKEPNKIEKQVVKQAKHKMADGGEVESPKPSPKSQTEEDQNDKDIEELSKPRLMAQGGEAESEEEMVPNPSYVAGGPMPAMMPKSIASEGAGVSEPYIDPVSLAVGAGMAGSLSGAGNVAMNAVKGKAKSAVADTLIGAIKQAGEQAPVKGEAEQIGSKIMYQPGSPQVNYQKELAQQMAAKRPKNYAEGGDVEASAGSATTPEQNPQQNQPTIIINNGQPGQSMPAQAPLQTAAPQAPSAPASSSPGVSVADIRSYNTAKDAGHIDENGNVISQPQSPQAPAAQADTLAKAPIEPPKGQPAQFDPYGTNATAEAMQQGISEQEKGLAGQASAESAIAQGKAQELGEQIQNQKNIQATYQSHYNDLEDERQAFMQDIQEHMIDPQHYLNSMGTAKKVSTAIGLILGGMGGGLTHQENPALKMLNSQIDRDINAQAANLGAKENLLSANMRQFGNLRDATDMTRVMQRDIIANQMERIAAKSGGQMSQARYLQAVGQLHAQNAQALGQIAMRRTILGGMQSGQIAPERVVNMIVPENQRAEANKELTSAMNMAAARDNVVSAFDKLAQINTAMNRATSPLQTSRQVDALVLPIIASLSKETAGRFTEQDAHMLEALFPKVGNSPETNALNRAQALKLISEKMHFPILQTYGIDINGMGRFNQQGQSKIQESAPIPSKR